MEDYVHRIGRTGRAGSTGRATSFYTDRDMVFPFAILTSSLVHICWCSCFDLCFLASFNFTVSCGSNKKSNSWYWFWQWCNHCYGKGMPRWFYLILVFVSLSTPISSQYIISKHIYFILSCVIFTLLDCKKKGERSCSCGKRSKEWIV